MDKPPPNSWMNAQISPPVFIAVVGISIVPIIGLPVYLILHYDDAVNDFLSAIIRVPEYAVAHWDRANAYEKLGEPGFRR